MSVTKWCSSLYFTLKTTLFFHWIPFHYITFELNSLLLSSYPKQIRKKRFVSWGLELKSQTWKLDEVHKIHDVQGVPFLVKTFTGFFFLVLDEERCNMSWGQGKSGKKMRERGSHFNCIDNQSFLFKHEKLLGMGKGWERRFFSHWNSGKSS